MLAEIDRLQLAPADQMAIKIFQVGKIPTLAQDGDDFKTRLMMNLAANNPKAVAVEWLDNALQGENLYDQIQRIRDGKHATAEILAERSAENAVERDEPKTTPYIETRRQGRAVGLFRIVPKYNADTKEWHESECQWLCDVVNVAGIGRSENEDFIVLEWQPEGRHKK